MRTLNVYTVTYETVSGLHTLSVAATTHEQAKKQTKEYSATIKRVISAKRIGHVNVPLVVPDWV